MKYGKGRILKSMIKKGFEYPRGMCIIGWGGRMISGLLFMLVNFDLLHHSCVNITADVAGVPLRLH